MQIEVEVKGQQIKRINSPGSVEGTLNYLTCRFAFDGAEWENVIKTAYFKNRATKKIYSSLVADDGTCTVPWEALTDGEVVEFSVAGERDGYRITTGIESFYNSETVYGGQPSEPPTPSQYDQLIALAEQTKEIAESVREDADAGKFDGEPGKPGDPGKDGVSPAAKVEETNDGAVITVTDATGTTTAKLKNGKDGNPGQNATDEQVRTAVDAYMEEHPIQGDTEDIIKLAIKNEASGAVPVVISDSAEMGVQDLEMQGWTEQNQYKGKNLLPVDVGRRFTETDVRDSAVFAEDGVTVSYNDIQIGTRKDIYVFGDGVNLHSESSYVDVPEITPGRYHICNDSARISFYVVVWRNGASVVLGFSTTSTTPITIEEGDKFRIFFGCSNPGDGVQEYTIHPMLVKDGGELTTYEPYTGGQPSPNPDYPQEIVSAGKWNEETQKWEYEIEVGGANLWSFEQSIEFERSVQLSFNRELPAGEYTFSAVVHSTDTDASQCLLILLTADGGQMVHYIGRSDGDSRVSAKISISKPAKKISLYASTLTVTSEGDTASFSDIMLNAGDTDLPYEPYRTPQTATLTSDRPLTKWDRLEKRNGQWGWVYKSGKKVIDGTETYFASGYGYISEKSSNAYINNNDMIKGIPGLKNGHCNRLTYVNVVWATVDSIGFCYNINQIHMRISNDSLGTTSESTPQEVVSAMKNYMSQQYNDGNPFVFWYETAEETFVPLSESEQEALNALRTYYPTTVLDNDQGCEMSVQYIADTKAYIDSKIAAIQAAVVNTI